MRLRSQPSTQCARTAPANGATVRNAYEPLLDAALRWRYVTAATGLSALVLTGGVALGGGADFQFAPSIENEFMTASITMPLGVPAEATAAAVAKYEAGAARLRAAGRRNRPGLPGGHARTHAERRGKCPSARWRWRSPGAASPRSGASIAAGR